MILRPRAKEFATGAACLALGGLVYVVARHGAWLLPSTSEPRVASVARFAGQLPSLFHALAFSLMTAAALGPERRAALLACAAWAAADVLLETAQQPWFARQALALLPSVASGGGFVDHVHAYFTVGRFDPYDALAAIAGSTIAFGILNAYRRIES